MAPSKYDSKQYWDDRFLNEDSFEWLASYSKLQPILDTAISKTARVLNLGCGNSYLPFDMYNSGYQSLDNMDFSATVIEKMVAKTEELYGAESPAIAAIRWTVQDALKMDNIEEGSWDAVIDKSTSDCIACMDTNGELLETLSRQLEFYALHGYLIVEKFLTDEEIDMYRDESELLAT
ncbi:hypothetical protein FBU59_001651 [Linderina macrospora]|uniref:Uncharacterized protein n=1 Tax=Linderina macrospora TaxID=4868 RepID=A0ACC1JDE0_9FUNG|nr:hypothetical protein FBU59_001651 [Linderina macrospora]